MTNKSEKLNPLVCYICKQTASNAEQVYLFGEECLQKYFYPKSQQLLIRSKLKIRLWDVETSKSLHVFNGHKEGVWCVDISPLQSNSNNDNNKMNNIGVIGGNGYTICSGSWDNIIRIWDIETTKQFNVLKGHKSIVRSVKYGSNELSNTILSGSSDKSVRLWDIRFGQQIQVIGNSNVICSGSLDNTIRFWDIRSNKKELYAIEGNGILCLKFIKLKKKLNKEEKSNGDCCVSLCFGSTKCSIDVWG
ncbi:hypothetical protein RFI_38862 [Reticulomyxa filosa]|uniref:Uncharacterized protein n=1 Tax=Reticulomyxa filosa TaxID=46433 RepID=X6LCZ0_RETFI|nr:hypothetical protein RFI_38862 [Reticulomyxa filosa]|eukprot:ETN98629.1 hypothetical protein RFI_38862 [Reticulomyxa filosa]